MCTCTLSTDHTNSIYQRTLHHRYKQFYDMLGHAKGLKVVSVEYYGYENSVMQERFNQQKADFRNGGRPSDIVWVFHGTAEKNVEAIMKDGFRYAMPTQCFPWLLVLFLVFFLRLLLMLLGFGPISTAYSSRHRGRQSL